MFIQGLITQQIRFVQLVVDIICEEPAFFFLFPIPSYMLHIFLQLIFFDYEAKISYYG